MLTKDMQIIQDGKTQILRIPDEFHLINTEVTLRKDGDSLIIEPKRKQSLLEVIANLTGTDEEFPDVDRDLLPLEDVNI